MTVEIICVGTEILMGNIVNTNAAFLAEGCASLGLNCYYQTVVGDNEKRLTENLELAMSRSELILVSGGLGPTEDDLTKETAAKVCGLELREDPESRRVIEEFFKKRGKEPTKNNWKQALIPEGAKPIPNPNGTAPGVLIELKNRSRDRSKNAHSGGNMTTRIILMPGPPSELIPMFQSSVAPYLQELSGQTFFSKMVKIVGIGESRAETMIGDLIDAQDNPTIATYAKTGEVHIRVTASGATQKEAKKICKPVVKEIKSRFGTYVYATDEKTTLEQALVEMLLKEKMTVACAESCTGGLLSARIINVPGVSDAYKTGFITYSNKAKRKLLGVKKTTLAKYGAVSARTAEEMVRGLAAVTKADVTLSVTGIAGPDGGSEEKPVGLVYIGCLVRGQLRVKEYRFSGSRQKIRESAVTEALVLARECILELFSQDEFGQQDDDAQD